MTPWEAVMGASAEVLGQRRLVLLLELAWALVETLLRVMAEMARDDIDIAYAREMMI